MSKKKKKSIRSKDRSDSDLLKAAERAEAASRLKEAYGHYKELNKRHPGKYDEILLRIQIARVEAFLQDGALESAKQMITSLKGQISNAALKEFELRIAVAQSDKGTATEMVWRALNDKAALEPKSYLLLLESLIFSDSAPPDDGLLENSDIQTMLAVREGFLALCENKSEALSDALSKIPRSSVLAHWKLLLRALEAWYTRNDELLEKCLQKLTNIEGKGAYILQGLKLLQNKASPVDSQSLGSAFAIHGLKNIADDLIEIDRRILKDDIPDAFKFAQRQFSRFISQKSDEDRIITEGFVRLYRYATHEDSYHKFIDKLIAEKRTPASLRLPFMRENYNLGIEVLNCRCVYCIFRQGENYLNTLKAVGTDKKEIAHLRYHLATRLIEEIENQQDSLEENELELCTDLLEEALKEDPEMIRAGLLMAKCYFRSGDASKGNVLLDELARKFPEDPAVLFAAGCRCIERKTFVRGLKQLEQAYAVDPHLPKLVEKYVEGLLTYALQCYSKRLLDKGRNCFEKMKPHLRECPYDADFTLGIRWMRLRQLELETSFGNDLDRLKIDVDQDWEGKETLREIVSHFITERFGNPGRARKSIIALRQLFSGKTLIKELEPNDVYALFAYVTHDRSNKDKVMESELGCLNFIRNYLMVYTKGRLEGIIKLLWAAIPDYINPGDVLKATKIWSKADRQNPQLKLMHIMALEVFDEPTNKLLNHLDKAMEIARTRGDGFALTKGSELRKKIEQRYNRNHFDHEPESFQSDNDYYDEADDSNEDDDPSEFIFEGFYQKWQNLEYNERIAFENRMKAAMGKSAAKILIGLFKDRMKADKQENDNTTKIDKTDQMHFEFNP